jgi:hypothetical protein
MPSLSTRTDIYQFLRDSAAFTIKTNLPTKPNVTFIPGVRKSLSVPPNKA